MTNYKRYYFQNAVICGNCNGSGLQGYMDYCRACRTVGYESFQEFMRYREGDPIALAVEYNECLTEFKKGRA